MKKSLFFAALFLISALATGWVAYGTMPYKLGVAPDSISYLSVSKHLAAGKGVAVYMQNLSTRSESIAAWPPLYPAILTLWHLGGAHFYEGTWTLNLLLLFLNIFAIGFLVYLATSNGWLGLGTALLFGFDARTQAYHAWVLSEPLSILWVHISLLLFFYYLKNSKDLFFILSFFFLSLAPVTRYITAIYIPVIAGLFLLTQEPSLSKRLKKAFLFGLSASVPIIYWMSRNYLVTHKDSWTGAKRTFGSLIHDPASAVPLLENFKVSMQLISSWLWEYLTVPGIFLNFFIFLAGIYLILEYLRLKNSILKIFIAGCFFLTMVYVIGLNLVLRLSSFQFPMPDRYVYPIYEFILILLLLTGHLLVERSKLFSKPASTVCQLLLIILFFTCLSTRLDQSWAWAQKIRDKGIDESQGKRWQFVERIKWLPN